MAPKAKSSTAALAEAPVAETETPPKAKSTRKRAASSVDPEVAAADSKRPKPPSIFQMLKKVATPMQAERPEHSQEAVPASKPLPVEPADETMLAEPVEEPATKDETKQAEPAEQAEPAAAAAEPKQRQSRAKAQPKQQNSKYFKAMQAEPPREPKQAEPEQEVVPEPMQSEPAHEPVQAEPADEPMAHESESENASISELKLGSLSYTCLCTRDPDAAGRWAERVTRDVDAKSCQVGSAVDLLGMDCEWAAPWHRGPGVPDRLATVQLCHHGSNGRCALVFSVAGLGGKLPSSVVALLGDARLAKVGVNIAGDATRLVRDFGCPVRGLYDLSNLNKKSGQKLKKSISLEELVRTHCPEDMHITKSDAAMEKGVRTSNWEAWPLSAEQIHYSAMDAALGVMAFACKFGSGTSDCQLSALALEALVNLEECNGDTTASAKSASSKNKSAKAARGKSTDEVDATDDTPTEAKKPKDNTHFFVAMRNSIVKAPNIGKKDHPQGSKNALAGLCIIVSGVLDSFERKDMDQYVINHGGSVSKAVTAKVTHLITDHGEAGPSKLAKCKELGIPVVSEDVILEMVRASQA